MIGWLSKEEYKPTNDVDVNNIDMIINKIENINNKYCKYVTKLYYEYFDMINDDNKHDIKDELKNKYNSFVDIKNNISKISNCNLIISPSHDNTYFILKELNKNKKENVLVICFDMHSDTYETNDKLWKGNVFSKLLKEKYINNFMVVGIPKKKIKNTLKDIENEIKNNIIIKKNYKIEKDIKRLDPTTIFISIDIDCLNTRKSKYTALEYCPMTILSNISRIKIDNLSNSQIINKVINCIYVKNELGYANLYKVGENKMNIDILAKLIIKIKKYCQINNIKLGFNDKLYADITEVNGYDYNMKTINMLDRLIEVIIGR